MKVKIPFKRSSVKLRNPFRRLGTLHRAALRIFIRSRRPPAPPSLPSTDDDSANIPFDVELLGQEFIPPHGLQIRDGPPVHVNRWCPIPSLPPRNEMPYAREDVFITFYLWRDSWLWYAGRQSIRRDSILSLQELTAAVNRILVDAEGLPIFRDYDLSYYAQRWGRGLPPDEVVWAGVVDVVNELTVLVYRERNYFRLAWPREGPPEVRRERGCDGPELVETGASEEL